MDLLSSKSEEKSFSNLFTNKWQFDTAFPSLKPAVATELLQNCDLPPPLKRFSPEQSLLGVYGYSNKQSLLMAALQRSQSRAREAERKEKLAIMRSGKLGAMLLEESMKLLVMRRWAMLLELEIAVLRREEWRGLGDDAAAMAAKEEEEEGQARAAGTKWCLVVALCIGIVGAGYLFGGCCF
ncbi:hypothetical protein KFK09_022197 [Dendrobium nobile]|uniref:Uncharacterized protein n=1 Tax=Dendrobium nobile TaxID=94219 RepID=A0A8T3AIF0_DENNO|nr:hypothetical protein KFK09_022197 [Dendrobium nobile]